MPVMPVPVQVEEEAISGMMSVMVAHLYKLSSPSVARDLQSSRGVPFWSQFGDRRRRLPAGHQFDRHHARCPLPRDLCPVSEVTGDWC